MLEPQNPSKNYPESTFNHPKWVPKSIKIGAWGCLSPKILRKSSLKSPKWVPKSRKMTPGTPWEYRSRPGRPRDAHRNSGYLPFITFLAEPGRSKGRFWDPGGSRKDSKIDPVRIGRHFGGPRRAKQLLQRGVPKRSENGAENGAQNRWFLKARTPNPLDTVGSECIFCVS